MTLIINVLQSHIERGVKEDEVNCPVALALRGTMEFRDRWRNFMVWDDAVLAINSINADDLDIICRLPFEATEFIRDFDAGELVKPFSFKIEVNP